ncbi:hypothetical protein [Confluentibacter flavum]|uniref:hypothetical protein n=1 Tax=Confluentibacter flavum TaxID=1909700 RepID=UPI0012FF5289|nr:hypothetical protein [Confluentibacter flavum]
MIFEFSEYHYTFTFDIKDDFEEEIDEDFYSYNTLDDTSKIERLLDEISEFTSFEIKGYEYLGWREDLTEGKSITNEMYSLIKQINLYGKNAIQNHYTDIKYGDAMCPDAGNYMFSIEISEKFWWDVEFAKHIVKIKIDSIVVPEFYTIFFRKNQPIKDDKSLPILSTNTKVRRLGYFKILSLFLDENKQIPTSNINKRFETFCLKYKDVLDNSEFNKGLIKETKNGISAKPYLEMAIDIELLNKINNILYVGKSLKVYQALKNDYSKSSNIFELTTFDKMYFLECILRYDYFYFSNLLELIYIEGKATYSKIVSEFQSKLIKSLEEYKKQNQYSFQGYKSPTYNSDRKVVSKLDIILNRIRKWEKAEVYLEHLIMPRLNWMLDFGIISFDNSKNEYNIEKIGDNLFKHLCIWNDINTEKIISPSKFLDNFMIHLFDDCFNNNIVSNPDDIKSILDRIYKHIENSFEIFKTLAPNRVTASQAANYTKYKLYMDDKIKVGYSFILNKLSEKEQDKFIFKYQEQYQDGYIQIK